MSSTKIGHNCSEVFASFIKHFAISMAAFRLPKIANRFPLAFQIVYSDAIVKNMIVVARIKAYLRVGVLAGPDIRNLAVFSECNRSGHRYFRNACRAYK